MDKFQEMFSCIDKIGKVRVSVVGNLAKKIGMPPMAAGILLHLYGNPELYTAKQISDTKGYKENILSVNIEKLVKEGYLERRGVEGDRRKVRLVITEKAQPLIDEAEEIFEYIALKFQEGISEEDKATALEVIKKIAANAEKIDLKEILND